MSIWVRVWCSLLAVRSLSTCLSMTCLSSAFVGQVLQSCSRKWHQSGQRRIRMYYSGGRLAKPLSWKRVAKRSISVENCAVPVGFSLYIRTPLACLNVFCLIICSAVSTCFSSRCSDFTKVVVTAAVITVVTVTVAAAVKNFSFYCLYITMEIWYKEGMTFYNWQDMYEIVLRYWLEL